MTETIDLRGLVVDRLLWWAFKLDPERLLAIDEKGRPVVELEHIAGVVFVEALLSDEAVMAARKVAYSGMDPAWVRQCIAAAVDVATQRVSSNVTSGPSIAAPGDVPGTSAARVEEDRRGAEAHGAPAHLGKDAR
jgi:hypothetical protein